MISNFLKTILHEDFDYLIEYMRLLAYHLENVDHDRSKASETLTDIWEVFSNELDKEYKFKGE